MGQSIEQHDGARLQHLRRVAGVPEVVLELDAPLRAAYLEALGQQNETLCRDVRAWLDSESATPPAAQKNGKAGALSFSTASQRRPYRGSPAAMRWSRKSSKGRGGRPCCAGRSCLRHEAVQKVK